MDNALAAELQIKTTGAAGSIAELRAVANEAKCVGEAATQGASGFGALEHGLSRLGGGSRESMMLLRGLGEAIRGAEGGWASFGSAIMQTGAFVGAAVAINKIIESAKEISEQTDDIYKQLGQPMPSGFFANLVEGWGIILGTRSGGGKETAPITKEEILSTKAGHMVKQGKEWEKERKKEDTLTGRFENWLASNKDALARMSAHERETAFAESFAHIKEQFTNEKNQAKFENQQEEKRGSVLDRVTETMAEEKALGKPGWASSFFNEIQLGKAGNTSDLGLEAKVFERKWNDTNNRAKEMEGERQHEAKSALEKDYREKERLAENNLHELEHLRFAVEAEEGSKEAYKLVTEARGSGEDKTELKRLQAEQLAAQQEMAKALLAIQQREVGVYVVT